MSRPLGLGLPDRRWEGWGPSELRLAAELEPGAVLVVVHGEQPTEVREAQVAAVRRLVDRTGARLLLRGSEPDVPSWASTDWAGECARRAGFFSGVVSPIETIPGDELNLASQGGSLGWTTQAGTRWLLRFSQRYRRLRGGDRLHVPAPDPGGDGSEAVAFWEACARAGVGKRFDVVDVRAYSDVQVRTLPRLAHEILGLPVDITAWNGAHPSTVADVVRRESWLGVACYAGLAGEDVARRHWLVERPDLVAAFRAAQESPGSVSPRRADG